MLAYDESIDKKTREINRKETETLAILTGLEIDSAKSGIKPDLSKYLDKKDNKRSQYRNTNACSMMQKNALLGTKIPLQSV